MMSVHDVENHTVPSQTDIIPNARTVGIPHWGLVRDSVGWSGSLAVLCPGRRGGLLGFNGLRPAGLSPQLASETVTTALAWRQALPPFGRLLRTRPSG